MKAHLTLIGLAGAALLAGCKSQEPAPVPTDTGLDTGTQTFAAPGMTAQDFANAVAASDQFEIQSSKLAATKAKDARIKKFAAAMVDAHTKTSDELKSAAAGIVPAVTVQPQLTKQQQADLDALKDSGDRFDTMYVNKQIAAHQQAADLLRGYAGSGATGPLKDFADKTLPAVTSHLADARKLPQ